MTYIEDLIFERDSEKRVAQAMEYFRATIRIGNTPHIEETVTFKRFGFLSRSETIVNPVSQILTSEFYAWCAERRNQANARVREIDAELETYGPGYDS